MVTVTFDFLIFEVVSESRVTWAIPLCQFWSSYVPYASVLDVPVPMSATDRRQTPDRRQTASSLNAPAY